MTQEFQPRVKWALSPRETQVCVMFAQGFDLDEIARNFSVTVDTTRSHLRRAGLKFRHRNLNVASPELMREALRADGLISD
jgi:DNA-binding CsgD family transcriptional regulator